MSREIKCCVGGNFDLLKNPKKTVRSCTFCQKCKSVAGCPRRTELTMGSYEYVLSSGTPGIEDTLRARINAMPITPLLTGSVIGSLSTEQSSANFIIHSASLVKGGGSDIQGMNFCVSFLSSYAQPMEKVCVSGRAMNSMITHNKRKKKYVFDETIILKDGWMSRGNETATYEATDEDDIPLSKLLQV